MANVKQSDYRPGQTIGTWRW